jgi:hypothetical protein
MKRRLVLSLALALSLSAIGASSALAHAQEGAQKAPLYGPSTIAPCPTGAAPTPETFGFAVLNSPGDETTVTGEIALKHASPNTTYNVLLAQDEPGCNTTPLGELTTNARGNGNLHFSTERIPGTTKFFVGVLSGGELFANAAVELD